MILWIIGAGLFDRPIRQQPKLTTAAAETQQREPQGPVSIDFMALIHAVETQGRANRAEEQAEDRGKRNREIITITLLFVTMAAIIMQVTEMIKVYDPIKEQARAATNQAVAAKTQSDNSDKALIESQRAWAGPTGVKLNGAVILNTEVKVVVGTRNSGREPANDFTWDILPLVSSDDKNLAQRISSYVHECFSSNPIPGRQVLWPSTGLGTGFDFTAIFPKEMITAETISGEKPLIIEGCLVYKTFDTAHHSSFCYFLKNGSTPPDSWNLCVNGNFAD